MIISSRINHSDISNNLDGEPIDRVSEIKYFGVTIDNKLTFRTHIDTVIKKIAKKHGVLCRLKNDFTVASKGTGLASRA